MTNQVHIIGCHNNRREKEKAHDQGFFKEEDPPLHNNILLFAKVHGKNRLILL